MSLSPSTEERDGVMVLVRLSQVPVKKRLLVAERIIRAEGLVGEDALLFYLAAQFPRTDPELLVPEARAAKVLSQPRKRTATPEERYFDGSG